jgi:hypothetical protein
MLIHFNFGGYVVACELRVSKVFARCLAKLHVIASAEPTHSFDYLSWVAIRPVSGNIVILSNLKK